MANSRDLELGTPLLKPQAYYETKNAQQRPGKIQEIQECIDILNDAKRKAHLFSLFTTLAILAGSIYLFYWFIVPLKNKLESEATEDAAAEQNIQLSIKANIAAHFNQTWFTHNNASHPCSYYFPNSYPMMQAGNKTDCCKQQHQVTGWIYEPCVSKLKRFIWAAPPYNNWVQKYCEIEPSDFTPYLVGRTVGIIFSSVFTFIQTVNLGALYFNWCNFCIFPLYCFCCRLSQKIQKCFIPSNEMQKLRDVAKKNKLSLNVENECTFFETLITRFEAKKDALLKRGDNVNVFTFFCGMHQRLGQDSPLRTFREDPLYDENLARTILEF